MAIGGDREPRLSSRSTVREIMSRYDIRLKKSLGQNFLTDEHVLHKIVQAAELGRDTGVLEIGPGIGALTQALAERAGKVVAVEIDGKLIPVLTDLFRPYDHVTIIHGDILKLSLRELFQEHFTPCRSVHVVANLPYYATSPIVMHLLEAELPLDSIVIMIQKEVAERICASPGGKEYGSLSVAVQFYGEPEIVTIVPGSAFIPKPAVDSAVIRLKIRREPAVRVDDRKFFFKTVRASLAQRRKTIWNNLLSAFGQDLDKQRLQAVLERAGIDPARRGETLSLEEFAALANALWQESEGKR
jgi:16S rRNA (adenine1518-N6/adenine1519-N6)-dimethyltransferase